VGTIEEEILTALLKEVVSRVGVLKNPDNPGTEIAWTELTSAARHLGLELYGTDVRRGNDLESAFAALTKGSCRFGHSDR
jgi:ABC-type uncharacterized transport system substrate-binding protein